MSSTFLIEDNGTRTSFSLFARGEKFEPKMTIHAEDRGEWDACVLSHGSVERVDFACVMLSEQGELFFSDPQSIRSLICTLVELEEELTTALAVPQKYDPQESAALADEAVES